MLTYNSEGKNYFEDIYTDMGLIFRINNLTANFPKDRQMVNKHNKGCLMSSVMKSKQINLMAYYFILTNTAIISKNQREKRKKN